MADENVQNPQAENEEMTAEQLDEQHRVRLEKLAALKAAGKDFTPSTNDRIAATGNVGQWLGFTFVEANGATGSIKYYDHTGAQKTVDMSKVQYVMYYHETLSVVSNFEVARIIDSERFAGSLAQVEMNTGYRVTNSKLARVRKVAGAG